MKKRRIRKGRKMIENKATLDKGKITRVYRICLVAYLLWLYVIPH